MSHIFVSQEENVKITAWSGLTKEGKARYWIRPEDKPNGIASEEEHVFTFRKPNFKDSTDLMDTGFRLSEEGKMDVSFAEIRYRRLEILLRSWNLKDDKGKDVPAIAENVAKLNPTFAMIVAVALEKELGFKNMLGEEADTEENEDILEENP